MSDDSANQPPDLASAREAARLARKAQRQAQKQATILAQARALLEQDGPDGLTMARLAEATAMSAPTLYYYFPNKESVADGICVALVAEETAAMQAALADSRGGVASVLAVMQARLDHYMARPASFRILYEFVMRLGVTQEALKNHVYPQSALVMGELESRLASDQAQGTIHAELQPRQFANVAFFTAQGIIQTAIAMAATGGLMRFGAQQLLDEAKAMIRRSAAPHAPASPWPESRS